MLRGSKTKNNRALDFYRYFFAFFICTLHFKEYYGNPYPFGGAYLAVEFFLIVSGYFLMKTIKERPTKNAEEDTLQFAKNRFYRLYPQYILSWFILAAYRVFFDKSATIKEILRDYLGDIFMVQMTGIGKWLNAAMWYVSALFLVSIVLFYLSRKFGKAFTHIVMPCICLVLYSFFYQTRGMLAGIGWNTMLIMRDGFWRALAGVSLGGIIYNINLWITRVNLTGSRYIYIKNGL